MNSPSSKYSTYTTDQPFSPRSDINQQSFPEQNAPAQSQPLLQETSPWGPNVKIAEKHDMKMCEMLKDELDNFLVFAGLFSGVLSAFTLASLPWLAPTEDNPSPISSCLATIVNCFWFASLSASVSAASIAILCLQWIRQYRLMEYKPTREMMITRHQRFLGFSHWQVANITSSLPVLLQLALLLFGVGLAILLWSLNQRVAIAFAVIGLVNGGFVIFTMLAPTYQWWRANNKLEQCPYQSPQAWLCFVVFNFFLCLFNWVWTKQNNTSQPANWNEFNDSWRRRKAEKDVDLEDSLLQGGIIWLDTYFGHDLEAVRSRAEIIPKLKKRIISSTIDHLRKQPTKDQDFSLHDDNLKDYQKILYLSAHAETHPQLDRDIIQEKMTFMNRHSQSIPGIFKGWRGWRRLGSDVMPLPIYVPCLIEDQSTLPQYFECLEKVALSGNLTPCNLIDIWNTIGCLFEYSFKHKHFDYFPCINKFLGCLNTQMLLKASTEPPLLSPTQEPGDLRERREARNPEPGTITSIKKPIVMGLSRFATLHRSKAWEHLEPNESRKHLGPLLELMRKIDSTPVDQPQQPQQQQQQQQRFINPESVGEGSTRGAGGNEGTERGPNPVRRKTALTIATVFKNAVVTWEELKEILKELTAADATAAVMI